MESERTGRVTGIGGIFFKVSDPESTRRWYHDQLGIETDAYGTNFEWRKSDDPGAKGFTQWSPFASDTNYFSPSGKDFMINYRVCNIEELLERLRRSGIAIVQEIEQLEYGKFAQILDPDGIKIELWEPDDVEYEKIVDGTTR